MQMHRILFIRWVWIRIYDYQNSPGFLINRTARIFAKSLDFELRSKVGITFGQWKIIVMLSEQDGLTQKEIADRIGVEGPTLIPMIDKMEKDGFVRREADPDDRRNNKIRRTQKAELMWRKMTECALEVRKRAMKNIKAGEVEVLRTVLNKIYDNLGEWESKLQQINNYLLKELKSTK
jgi:MarR family transcriptional regulator for hemolysin